MSIKDKFCIGFIILLVVILGISLKSEAWIVINGTTINCEYELAKYASENPTGFVMAEVDVNWLLPQSIHTHNVTGCGCEDKTATIEKWNTVHCVNHNQGNLSGQSKKSHIATVVDIEWNYELGKYQTVVRNEGNGSIGIAPLSRFDELKYLVSGIQLAVTKDTKGKDKGSGNYGSAMARIFHDMAKDNKIQGVNANFIHDYKLNLRTTIWYIL